MSAPESANRRILTIDDNSAIHEDFRKILAPGFATRASSLRLAAAAAALFGPSEAAMFAGGEGGFQLDSALQGEQGAHLVDDARVAGRPYAMAFVDVRMPPGIDGIETVSRIWKHDPDVQIVLCSAYSDYSWEQIAERLGQDSRLLILKKPFDAIEVRQMACALTAKWTLQRDGRLDAQRLAAARDEALAASRAKSRFLANMSHEIRTPLNGVLGMLQLLLDTELDEDQRDCAQTATTSAFGLLAVLNDVLDMASIETGKLTLSAVPFDLLPLLEEVLGLHRVTAVTKGIELGLSLEVPEALPPLVGDPARLRQILHHFIGNAVKFTTRGGVRLLVHKLAAPAAAPVVAAPVVAAPVVAVHASAAAAVAERPLRLRFDIVDTGIGITPEVLAALFQPFVQGDSSNTRVFGGTGLGLALSKQLVLLMGGDTQVHSTPGQGSTFSFTADFGIATGPGPGMPVSAAARG